VELQCPHLWALHFLPNRFIEKDLKPWLNMASFWAGAIIFTFLFRMELLVLLEMLPSLYILSLFIINYDFLCCSYRREHLLNSRRPTWRMVCNWTWSVMDTHVPWRSTLKHGKFKCGSMGFLSFSRARTLIQEPRHLGTISTQILQSSMSSSGISILNVLNHCHFFVYLHCDAHCLHFLSRYFTRELLPLGAI
jgi:hypothetical protein